jgi:LmbE family N-acetylglucosaminyl deacetylase
VVDRAVVGPAVAPAAAVPVYPAAVEPFTEDWTRAVAVVAHPDDLEYGAASAVARWTAAGKEVAYVLVTSGEAGIDGMAPAEAGPLREEEERRSAAVVGVSDVSFLGHPDGVVEAGLPLRRDLAAAFRRLRPEILLTLSFDLTWAGGSVNHADHRATGLAVLDAARDAANRWVFEDAGPPWAGTRQVAVVGAADPTHFVDVTGSVAAGVASLQEHRAYLAGLAGDFDPERFIRETARHAGEAAGCEYAVGVRVYHVG